MPQTHPFNVNNYYSINASSFQIIILKPIATNYLLGYKMPLKRPVELEIVGFFAMTSVLKETLIISMPLKWINL